MEVMVLVDKKMVLEFSAIDIVREAVSYRGLFTAGWFGVREKHCSRLEIYDRLRASEQVWRVFVGCCIYVCD